MTKVSIIVNCFNGEEYLAEALDSIYAQTEQDWEIIFFDNQSTDRSAEIAQGYGEKLKYHRAEEFVPLGAARQQAVLHACGKWVAFLDTDDRWYTNKLSTQLEGLEDSEYLFCFSGILEISKDGREIGSSIPNINSGNILGEQLKQFTINMVTPMFDRKKAQAFGINFDPNITASEEYNVFMRLAAKGPCLVQNVILGEYRIYDGSLTDKKIAKWGYERMYTLDQLVTDNPSICEEYKNEFQLASARGRYYDARYQMSKGNTDEAKKIMQEIAFCDRKYRILKWTLLIPRVWNLVHSRKIKLLLTRIIY